MKLHTYLHRYNGVHLSICILKCSPYVKMCFKCHHLCEFFLEILQYKLGSFCVPRPLDISLSCLCACLASPLAQILKNLPAMQEI